MTETKPAPFLRPLNNRSAAGPNLKHLHGKEPKNLFEAVTLAVQAINSAIIQPLNKEMNDFIYVEVSESLEKLLSGAGRQFSPIKRGHLIEETFANARNVAQVAMKPFSLLGDIYQGISTDWKAKKKAEEIEANGLAIIAKYTADPKTLTSQENKWLMEHLNRCFKGKNPTDSELNQSVARLAEFYLYSMQGRGKS